MKEISTRLTFFYKYLLIVVWIVIFGAITYKAAAPKIEANAPYMHYIIIWSMVAVFIFFTMSNIKKVALKGKKLYVSNFFKEEVIDVSNVESVNGTSFLSPKLVWITLKERSSFGSKIYFIPVFRNTPGLSKHPIVQELIEEFGVDQSCGFRR